MKSFLLFLLSAVFCYCAAAQCTAPVITASGPTSFCEGGSVTLSVPLIENTWTQKEGFGGGVRQNAVGFSIGSKGYIGTGYSNNVFYNDFWEYDPATGVWTQKANFGGTGRYYATGFSIGNKGYIGTGSSNDLKRDFWEYDPVTNMWTQKKDFGGEARYAAVGFSMGGKGYIGTGVGHGLYKDFWEYDPAANEWTPKKDFGGGARYDAAGFSIGGKGYIGTGGNNGDQRGNNSDQKDFWEYDPAANEWTPKKDFGGAARQGAVSFSIGTKGYIGTGYSRNSNGLYKDFWEYDPATSEWTPKKDFGGGARYAAVGFSIGSKGYIGTGNSYDQYTNDFWEYDPGQTYTWSPGGQTTPSIKITASGTYTVTATNALGCTATAATVVTVNALPAKPGITASGLTTFCAGGTVTLSAPDGYSSYKWSNGDTTQAITVTQSGTYTVTITNSNRCTSSSSDATTVTVNAAPEKPVITTSGATTFCPSGRVTLAAPEGFGSYAWSNGETKKSIDINQTGSYSVTVGNESGCTSTASDLVTVTVQDNEKPVITCPAVPPTLCFDASGNYTIAPLKASDNCSIANTTFAITGATTRTGTGLNASGAFNTGTSTITWTVTDASGNKATCQTTVVVNGAVNVAITDAKALPKGVDANTVYKGYAPASSLTLTAAVSGGSGSYTYRWSTGAIMASIKVNPATTTTYTVTVTDAKGCTATASKVVKVVDVRCGNKGDKVSVCHSGGTICIVTKDVSDHLAHGDYLGGCRAGTVTTMTTAARAAVAVEEVGEGLRVTASPNPSSTCFTLHISGNPKEKITVTVTDAVGRILEQRSNLSNGQSLRLGDAFRPGMYVVQIAQRNEKVTVKLLKQAD